MEPLCQSQILPYLIKLSVDYKILLLSFEKKHDWFEFKRRNKLIHDISNAGVIWIPLPYHKKLTILATFYDLSIGLLVSIYLVLKYNVKIVHVRSYPPSVIALILKKINNISFIFDMRGLWVDERVDGEIWSNNSYLYGIGKKFERLFFKHANAIISLSSAAISELKKNKILGTKKIIVIPTCTDLSKFYPKEIKKNENSGSIVLGYVGTVTGWYLFEPVLEFFKYLSEKKRVRFIILNRGEHDFIKNSFLIKKIPMDNVELKSVLHDDVPDEIQKMNLGIFFIKPVYSKIASCATKLGEFLACGIPCITNHGIGDHTEILNKSKTGVIINDLNQFEYSIAVDKTLALLNDPDTRSRCRNIAEDYFSLHKGVDLYSKLYSTLI